MVSKVFRTLLLIVGLLVGGSLVIMVGYLLVAEDRAAEKASAFCSRFSVGDDFNQAREAAKASGAYHPPLKGVPENRVAVSYMGAVWVSWHSCVIEGEEGSVVSVRQVHAD